MAGVPRHVVTAGAMRSQMFSNKDRTSDLVGVGVDEF